MAQIPHAPEMLHRLRRDHDPDRHGWCSHPTHAYRWERHPCAILRLADLVEGVQRHAFEQIADQPDVRALVVAEVARAEHWDEQRVHEKRGVGAQ